MTFVLQSFQQLRSIYGEDIEKILRSNSSNTIFLKSNDEELINELVRLSGVKHEVRGGGKSVSMKRGDIITMAEPTIGYNINQNETTALTANDLLFLAGPTPGNSITFSSGEMPIVNKLSTIVPMAAGLHRHLPQARMKADGSATENYSDSTMPTTNVNDSVNFLNKMIDGERMVRDRVEHARIAMEIKPTFLEIAKANNVTINELDGELAGLMMNVVYETFDRRRGVLASDKNAIKVPYHELAKRIFDATNKMRTREGSQEERVNIARQLREDLVACLMDENLKELTEGYRNKQSSQTPFGYDAVEVAKFSVKFKQMYPEPQGIKVDTRDVFAEAKNDPKYVEYDDGVNDMFDAFNPNHLEALEDLLLDIIDEVVREPKGVEVEADRRTNSYVIYVDNKELCQYISHDENNFTIEYKPKPKDVTKIVMNNAGLLRLVRQRYNEIY